MSLLDTVISLVVVNTSVREHFVSVPTLPNRDALAPRMGSAALSAEFVTRPLMVNVVPVPTFPLAMRLRENVRVRARVWRKFVVVSPVGSVCVIDNADTMGSPSKILADEVAVRYG
jgi:hypothetical protein